MSWLDGALEILGINYWQEYIKSSDFGVLMITRRRQLPQHVQLQNPPYYLKFLGLICPKANRNILIQMLELKAASSILNHIGKMTDPN